MAAIKVEAAAAIDDARVEDAAAVALDSAEDA